MKRIRIFFYILFLLCLNVRCFAQTNDIIDSLTLELTSVEGVEKVKLLILLSKETFSDIEESEGYALKGLALAREIDDWDGQTSCLQQISKIYSKKNESAEALRFALEAIQITEKYSHKIAGRGGLHNIVGANLMKIGAYKEAIEHRKKQAFWNRVNNNISDEYTSVSEIGSIYYSMKQYDSARTYFNKAGLLAEELSNLHYSAHSRNNIGLTFLKSQQLDSAKYYFLEAINIFKNNPKASSNDSLMVGIVSGNLSECYVFKNDKPLVISLLRKDLDACKTYNDYYNLSNSYLKLSLLYKKYNQIKLARLYNDSAYNTIIKYNHPTLLLRIYQNYIDIFIKIKDAAKAGEFMRKHLALNDSLYGQKVIDKMIEMRSVYHLGKINYELKANKLTLEKKKKELILMKNADEITRLKYFISLGVILLIIITGVFIYFRIKGEHSRRMEIQKVKEKLINVELKNKKLESIQLQEDLESKNEELTNYAIEITKNHQFVQELRDKLKILKKNGKGDTVEYMELLNQVNSQLRVEDQLREFQRQANFIHKNFNKKLMETNSSLTKNELYLCGLLRLNLSNKDIAIIRSVSDKAIRMSKYRLKQKFQLPKEDDLVSFLKNL